MHKLTNSICSVQEIFTISYKKNWNMSDGKYLACHTYIIIIIVETKKIYGKSSWRIQRFNIFIFNNLLYIVPREINKIK